jgi:hypothetical protein
MEIAQKKINESNLPEAEKVHLLQRTIPHGGISPSTKRLYESGWDPSRVTGAGRAP